MQRVLSSVSVVTLCAFQSSVAPSSAPLELGECSIAIEAFAGSDDGGIIIETESEQACDQFELRDPRGVPVMRTQVRSGMLFGAGGVRLEGDAGLSTLLARCGEGEYELRARALDGRVAVGRARLSHVLPTAVAITHPLAFQQDVANSDLVVTWTPVRGASSYSVSLESDEEHKLAAHAPASATSMHIPDELLAPSTTYVLEVAAVAANGNRTTTEIEFTTR